MSDEPASLQTYGRDINLMLAGARAWLREHPDAELLFFALPPQVGVTGNLDICAPWYGLNAASRELLLEMDRASGNRASLMMARYVIDFLRERKEMR